MIGFEDEVSKDSVRSDEGPETRNLDKKMLYEMIALLFFIAPYGSKGMTREYLLNVHSGKVYRVRHGELRHFEVDLTPQMTKKLGVVNNGLLVKKINIILKSREQPELGFTQYEPPEQVNYFHKNWLYRIARYIDTSNLTEFYEKPVFPEPPLTQDSSHIAHIYYGRIKASKIFIANDEIKFNRKLWDALRAISDCYRALQSQRLMVDVQENNLKEAKTREKYYERILGDQISKSALTYLTLQHPHISADEILKANEANNSEVREELNKTCSL